LLLIALFYLMTHYGTTYGTGYSCDILTGTTANLMPQHSAYDTSDDGAGTYSATAYPTPAFMNYLNRVNHAICRAVTG
jgi:hypothetical protein